VLASAGNITTGALAWRGYRNIDGTTQTIYAQITVLQNVSGTWKEYASTLATVAPPTLSLAPPDPYSPSALPKMGSQINVTSTGSGPWSPTPDQPASVHKYIDAMAALGMNVWRTALAWEILCYSGSTLDPTWTSYYDDILGYADSKGIKTYTDFGLCAPPSWAGSGATLSSNRQAFINTALTRWGSHFVALAVNNEPNGTEGGRYTAPAISATTFVGALQDLYAACRSYSSTFPVVLGDLAYADAVYLAQCYTAGAGGHFDAVAIHPYNYIFPGPVVGDPMIPQLEIPATVVNQATGPESSLVGGAAIIHETMRANGDGAKTVWVTEAGFATDNGGPAGSSVDDSPTQGTYLSTLYRQAARIPYLAGLITYRAYDVVNPLNPGYEAYGAWNRWGFMRDDGSHKASYAALSTTIANLKAGTG
jgi:hypothetical protein